MPSNYVELLNYTWEGDAPGTVITNNGSNLAASGSGNRYNGVFGVANNNTLTVSSDGAVEGSRYARLINLNTSAGTAFLGWSGTSAISPTNVAAGSILFRMGNYPSGGTNLIQGHADSSASTIAFYIGVAQSGAIKFQTPNGGAGTMIGTNGILSLNTWYRLEWFQETNIRMSARVYNPFTNELLWSEVSQSANFNQPVASFRWAVTSGGKFQTYFDMDKMSLGYGDFPTFFDSNAPIAVTSSDSNAISIVDNSSIYSFLQSTDQVSINETDASNVTARFSSTDAGGVSTSESIFFGTISITSNEAAVVSLTESSVISGYLLSSDSTTINSVESYNLLLSVGSTDGNVLSVFESINLMKPILSSDGFSVSLNETTGFSNTAAGAADAPVVSVVESYSIAVSSSVSDSLVVSSNETVDIFVSLYSSDSVSVSLSESQVTDSYLVSDDNAAILMDESTHTFKTMSSDDSVNVTHLESSSVYSNEEGTDSSAYVISESSDVVIIGIVEKTSSDLVEVYNSESFDAVIELDSNDTIDLNATDVSTIDPAGLIEKYSDDYADITIDESNSLYLFLVSDDVNSLPMIDTSYVDQSGLVFLNSTDEYLFDVEDDRNTTDVEVTAFDDFTLIMTEGANLYQTSQRKVYSWDGVQWNIGVIKIWDGQSWRAPIIKVWDESKWI